MPASLAAPSLIPLGARAHPGRLNFGSVGTGSTGHLLVAGRIELMAAAAGAVLGQARGGQVRAIGVSGDRRVAQLPDVALLSEQGEPGAGIFAWIGLFAPAGTPAERIARRATESGRAPAVPGTGRALEAAGFEPLGTPPAVLAELIRAEVAHWGPVIRRLWIRPESWQPDPRRRDRRKHRIALAGGAKSDRNSPRAPPPRPIWAPRHSRHQSAPTAITRPCARPSASTARRHPPPHAPMSNNGAVPEGGTPMMNRFRPSLLAAALLISATAPAFAQGVAQGTSAPASGTAQRPAAMGTPSGIPSGIPSPLATPSATPSATQAATPVQPGGQLAAPRPAATQPQGTVQGQPRDATPSGAPAGQTAPGAPRGH